MNKTMVDKKFIEDAKTMATDLYYLADFNGNKEIKKSMKAFIKKSDRYLERLESVK